MLYIILGIFWMAFGLVLAIALSGVTKIRITPRSGLIFILISFACGMVMLGLALTLS